MRGTDTVDLSQRLDRLERENRWWRCTASLAVVGVVLIPLVAATAAKAPEEIRAKKLVIVDDEGRQRIVLGWYAGYGLKIIGKGDKTRISLEDWNHGETELALHSQEGPARLKLTVSAEGVPSIWRAQ
jgi:hypothetical protein